MVVVRVLNISVEETANLQVRCPHGSATGCAVTTETLNATLSVAGTRAGLDGRFAVQLKNAVPDLFMIIHRIYMEPASNESERMLRKVVIRHKIRQKLVTVGGMTMLDTFLLTLDKR